MYLDSNYQNSRFGYPEDDLVPEMKDEKWFLKYAKALYSSFMNGNTAMTTTDYDNILKGRQYGAARQDPEQYKDILIGKKELSDAARKAWMNVNFTDIISVAPKFRRIIVGIFESQDHEIVASAIDETSGMQREDQKWKAWAKKANSEFLAMVDSYTGVEGQGSDYEPESMEELELYASMGGFKLKTEVALEGALQAVDHESNWKMIKQKLIGDAVDCGIMMVKDYTDVASKKVMKRYVDPYQSFYTKDENGDVSKFAEVRYYTIANVRRETDLTEKDLMNLAVSYRSNNGNLGNPYFDPSYNPDGSININYDEFIVPVLEFEFASIDASYRTTRTFQDGTKRTFREKPRTNQFGKTIPPKIWNSDMKQTSKLGVKVFRRGKWIIGTDYIWDYGLQYDMPRPELNTPRSSYHVRKLDGVSIMLSCKPDLDRIQLSNLRIQNAIALAPNSGVAYEYASIGGMTVGGKGMSEMDIIKMHRQTGSLLYKATTSRGGMIAPSSSKPFTELAGGIGPLLQELMLIINSSLENIRSITGVNQITDATGPNPEVGLGVSQLAVASTNNSLKPIYTNYIDIKEKSAENCAHRIQSVSKYNGKYRTYDKALGKAAWEVIKEGADFSLCEMGIKIQALPTAKEIEAMTLDLQKAIQSGRDGKPSLTMAEYFAIKRILMSGGGLKLAQVMLAFRERKHQQEAERLQQQNMQLNAQVAQQSEQVKSQAELQKIQMQAAIDKDMKRFETDEEIRKQEAIHGFKMKEITAQAAMKPETQTV